MNTSKLRDFFRREMSAAKRDGSWFRLGGVERGASGAGTGQVAAKTRFSLAHGEEIAVKAADKERKGRPRARGRWWRRGRGWLEDG
ncbi:MAG: hypothetical protein JRN46_02265 [Nitrososphaerota archaeon]|nr:hypothetical protein [Nitrososphaerota archaeon]